MKIVKIKGGLGNQLFQYSFASLLQEITPDDVKIDMSSFSGSLDDPIRKPRLLKMNVTIPIAGDNEIRSLCMLKHSGNTLTFKYRALIAIEDMMNRRYYREKNRAYIEPESIAKHSYFDGYWQSWRYVDQVWDTVRSELVPNYEINEATSRMIERVLDENSIFIGIRRGDYSQRANHYGSFGNTYYQKAMDYITDHVESPVFYIFSNDISWVKESIDFSNRTVFFREPEDVVDDFEDLLIMAACKHSIIINSTYHWWGARLNEYPGKIVVAPKNWFFDDKPIDIVPPRWIRIEE